MKTFKLLRVKGGKLYPLFVERCRELPMGEWLEAGMGELVDENHVKSLLGPLAVGTAGTPALFRLQTGSENGKGWDWYSGKLQYGANVR